MLLNHNESFSLMVLLYSGYFTLTQKIKIPPTQIKIKRDLNCTEQPISTIKMQSSSVSSFQNNSRAAKIFQIQPLFMEALGRVVRLYSCEEILYYQDGEAQIAQRSQRSPIHGSVQGQVGWSFEQPGLLEVVPVHGRGLGNR